MTNPFSETNRRRWEAAAASWAHHADTRGIWKKAHQNPLLALHPSELRWVSDINSKRVAVLGSGDNQVVFALAGLGAKVTSVDISAQQLNFARERAALLGLEIDFVRADVLDLSALEDGTFDLIYTGGHVAVWVADLRRFYAEGARILKPGGLFIVSEYHPFRRVWQEDAARLELHHNYFNRGPHRFELTEDVLYPAPGDLEQFEFNWTVADYVSALLVAGCEIIHVEEFGDMKEGWETAPLAGLPATLLLVGRRNGPLLPGDQAA